MRKFSPVLYVSLLILSLLLSCSGTKNGKPTITTKGPAKIKNGITFYYKSNIVPQKVFLTGTFNSWRPNHPDYKMTNEDGTWQITIKLAPGKYLYKFVVDGEWLPDNNNPNFIDDGFGKKNSVIVVK